MRVLDLSFQGKVAHYTKDSLESIAFYILRRCRPIRHRHPGKLHHRPPFLQCYNICGILKTCNLCTLMDLFSMESYCIPCKQCAQAFLIRRLHPLAQSCGHVYSSAPIPSTAVSDSLRNVDTTFWVELVFSI